jgi:transposase
MPAPHPPEFRQRAIELARQKDRPIAEVAKALGISQSCLRNWLRQADADEGNSGAALTTQERKEIALLRKEKRRLEVENEILRQAAAYFARENLPK